MNPYIYIYIYIYRINTIWGMFQVHVYNYTHFCFHVTPKKGQKWYFGQKTLGATYLKHGMHTQLVFGSNMGGIPPGCTSSHCCVKRKVPQKKTTKELLHEHTLIYILVCKYVCLHVCVSKHHSQTPTKMPKFGVCSPRT